MPVGCVGATDVRHVAIMHYWALNEGLPVPAAKILETPFHAPGLRFRTINADRLSTRAKPVRTITAGNFPPVMARQPRTVSNESHVQTPIQPQSDAFKDIAVQPWSNASWFVFLPSVSGVVLLPKTLSSYGFGAPGSDT